MSFVYPTTNEISSELQQMIDELGINTMELAEMEHELNFDAMEWTQSRDDLITPVLPFQISGQRETNVDEVSMRPRDRSATATQQNVAAAVGTVPQTASNVIGVTTATAITQSDTMSQVNTAGVTNITSSRSATQTQVSQARQHGASATSGTSMTQVASQPLPTNLAEFRQVSSGVSLEDEQNVKRHVHHDESQIESVAAHREISLVAAEGVQAPIDQIGLSTSHAISTELLPASGNVPSQPATLQAGGNIDEAQLLQEELRIMEAKMKALKERMTAAETNRLAKCSQAQTHVEPNTNIAVDTHLTSNLTTLPIDPTSLITVTDLNTSPNSTKQYTMISRQVSPGTLEAIAVTTNANTSVQVNQPATMSCVASPRTGERSKLPALAATGTTFTMLKQTPVKLASGAQVIAAGVLRTVTPTQRSDVRRQLEPSMRTVRDAGEGQESLAAERTEVTTHNEGALHEFLELMRAYGTHQTTGYRSEKLAPINYNHPVWKEAWPEPKPREMTPGEAALVVEMDCKTTTAPHVRRRRGIHTYQQMLEEYSRYKVAPLEPYSWKTISEYKDWVSNFYNTTGKFIEMTKSLWQFNPPIEVKESRKSSITFFETCQNTLHGVDEYSTAIALHHIGAVHQRCRKAQDQSYTPPESCLDEKPNEGTATTSQGQSSAPAVTGQAEEQTVTSRKKQKQQAQEDVKRKFRAEYIACEPCGYGLKPSFPARLKSATDDISKTEAKWIAQQEAANSARKTWCTVLGGNLYRAKIHVKEWQKLVGGYGKTRDYFLDQPMTVFEGIRMAQELRQAKARRAESGSEKGSERSAADQTDDAQTPRKSRAGQKAQQKGKKHSSIQQGASTANAVTIKQEPEDLSTAMEEDRVNAGIVPPPCESVLNASSPEVLATAIHRIVQKATASKATKKAAKGDSTEENANMEDTNVVNPDQESATVEGTSMAAQDEVGTMAGDASCLNPGAADDTHEDNMSLGEFSTTEVDPEQELRLLASGQVTEASSKADAQTPNSEPSERSRQKKRSKRKRRPISKSTVVSSSSDSESPAAKYSRGQSPPGGTVPQAVVQRMKRRGLIPDEDRAASPEQNTSQETLFRITKGASSTSRSPSVSGKKREKHEKAIRGHESKKSPKRPASKETRFTAEYKQQKKVERSEKSRQRKEDEERRKKIREKLTAIAKQQSLRQQAQKSGTRRLSRDDEPTSFDAEMKQASQSSSRHSSATVKSRCATTSPNRSEKKLNISPTKPKKHYGSQIPTEIQQQKTPGASPGISEGEASKSTRRKQSAPKRKSSSTQISEDEKKKKREKEKDRTEYVVSLPESVGEARSRDSQGSNTPHGEVRSGELSPIQKLGTRPGSTTMVQKSSRTSKSSSRTASPSMTSRIVSPQLVENALKTCAVAKGDRQLRVALKQLPMDVIDAAKGKSSVEKASKMGKEDSEQSESKEKTLETTPEKSTPNRTKRMAAIKSAEKTKDLLSIGPMNDDDFDALTKTVASEAQPKEKSKLPEDTPHSTPSTIHDLAIDDIDNYQTSDIPASKSQHKTAHNQDKAIKVERASPRILNSSNVIEISSEEHTSPSAAPSPATPERKQDNEPNETSEQEQARGDAPLDANESTTEVERKEAETTEQSTAKQAPPSNKGKTSNVKITPIREVQSSTTTLSDGTEPTSNKSIDASEDRNRQPALDKNGNEVSKNGVPPEIKTEPEENPLHTNIEITTISQNKAQQRQELTSDKTLTDEITQPVDAAEDQAQVVTDAEEAIPQEGPNETDDSKAGSSGDNEAEANKGRSRSEKSTGPSTSTAKGASINQQGADDPEEYAALPVYRRGGVFDTEIPGLVRHMQPELQNRLLHAADNGIRLIDGVFAEIAKNPPSELTNSFAAVKNLVMTPTQVERMAQEIRRTVKREVINAQIEALRKLKEKED